MDGSCEAGSSAERACTVAVPATTTATPLSTNGSRRLPARGGTPDIPAELPSVVAIGESGGRGSGDGRGVGAGRGFDLGTGTGAVTRSEGDAGSSCVDSTSDGSV